MTYQLSVSNVLTEAILQRGTFPSRNPLFSNPKGGASS